MGKCKWCFKNHLSIFPSFTSFSFLDLLINKLFPLLSCFSLPCMLFLFHRSSQTGNVTFINTHTLWTVWKIFFPTSITWGKTVLKKNPIPPTSSISLQGEGTESLYYNLSIP